MNKASGGNGIPSELFQILKDEAMLVNYVFSWKPAFLKIHVNHFMAQDDSFCANVISKCMLWVRGLVSLFEV